MKVHGEGLLDEDMKSDDSDQMSESELDECSDDGSVGDRDSVAAKNADECGTDVGRTRKRRANQTSSGGTARRRLKKNNKRMSLNSDGERDDDMNDGEDDEDLDEDDDDSGGGGDDDNDAGDQLGGQSFVNGASAAAAVKDIHMRGEDELHIKRNYSPTEQQHTGGAGKRAYRRPAKQKRTINDHDQLIDRLDTGTLKAQVKNGIRRQPIETSTIVVPNSATNIQSKLSDYTDTSPSTTLADSHHNHQHHPHHIQQYQHIHDHQQQQQQQFQHQQHPTHQHHQTNQTSLTVMDSANSSNYYSLSGYARQYHDHYTSTAVMVQQQLSQGQQTNQYERGQHHHQHNNSNSGSVSGSNSGSNSNGSNSNNHQQLQQQYATQTSAATSTSGHKTATAAASTAAANLQRHSSNLQHASACNQQQVQHSSGRSPTINGLQSKTAATTGADGASPNSTETTLSDW